MAGPAFPGGSETGKEQVADAVPKRIKELQFGILSKQEILSQSVLEVCDRALFDIDKERTPRPNGPLDRRMGISARSIYCETCGDPESTCNGHFGHVRLALPAFHAGYFKMTITVLNEICKRCSRILLTEDNKRKHLGMLRQPGIDNLKRTQICKKILEMCKKTRVCEGCGALNGVVKKASGQTPFKVIHDQFRAFNSSASAKKVPPAQKVMFDKSFDEAKKLNGEVEKHFKKAMDDLNPLKVLHLFKHISNSDCELLGMDPQKGRPEMFIWQYVPAPPIAIRPSVSQDSASTEDDITSKLADIVHISTLIREGLAKGSPTTQLMEQWDFLQLQIAMYINSDSPGLQPAGVTKTIRGFCQRLKGKQGRFRGNLSGKRVDFSGRTVISPDPNLSIDEVAVPELVAKILTYPERVTPHNIDKLRERIKNGPNKYPGAVYITNKEGGKLWLKYANKHTIQNLEYGAVVERHLEDGDIVLFNRQPSLHKLSILSHHVKVRPHRTFRLNECVCNPYNADFDGDEMNLHVPQTEEARAEAMELMGVKHNLATPKNGEPIISAIQDFITAAYLLSNKDNFFDRKTFTNICMTMFNADMKVDLPPPALLKPEAMWTGKQVFNVLMRPNKQSPVTVNLDAKCRAYKAVIGQHPDLDQNDGWLCIRNSEIMCGVMDKATIGSGKKDSIFYVILRDFGPDEAVQAMNRLSKLSARWLGEQGFSIGISDVTPGERLRRLKIELVERAYAECDALIVKFKEGKLEKASGCDEIQTLENMISGILNKVRQQAGDHCIAELSHWNSPLIMAKSGSKGSNINVSQMVAVVGQQIIGGARVQDGFQDRSLPHFPKNARQPPSKGFVRNGFFNGLSPSEFIFHAMSGREGLVDTAVKTAETGYMSRRLMKSLEDLSSNYDDTVRNSSSNIVQFKYGDDMLDPVDMEGEAQPVNFERTFNHSEAITWNNEERGLLPREILTLSETLLAPERKRYKRYGPLGGSMAYDDQTDTGADQNESGRNFLKSIHRYLEARAYAHAKTRRKLGLPPDLADFEDRLAKEKKALEAKIRTECQEGGKSDEETESAIQAIKARFTYKATGRPTKKDRIAMNNALGMVAKLSKSTLEAFVKACLYKYKRSQVEPGHAVGAVGAQSIGEPGTQMTLKTFHFAGVAGMSITEGVPRIKEIINASKVISTPIITCNLDNKNDPVAARIVKGLIEKTFLKDIIYYIEEDWSSDDCNIGLKLNWETINGLQLEVTAYTVVEAILRQKKLKISEADVKICHGESGKSHDIKVYVQPHVAKTTARTRSAMPTSLFERMEHLMRALPEIIIKGYPDAARAVITNEKNIHQVMVEGYGLRQCMNTVGVDGTKTSTNSVMEMKDVLGIEAARVSIVKEIGAVMRDMNIDPRHMQLLADVMTYKGEILGITRFGLSKMRDSVLQLASFEKTPDHLFDAAWNMKSDKIEGVSECIIMGQTMSVGTGAFKVVRDLKISEEETTPKPTPFEDMWRQLKEQRGKKATKRKVPATAN